MDIRIIKNPSGEKLDEMGVFDWPIWEKEISVFPWHYDQRETCYILEGEAAVVPEDGLPVKFGAGDLVIFPANMDCIWKITKAVRKHYNFG
ncbi:MAG: cupin domain-containing protein [bacterium]|nr:cupin domain-containing protein [bacterium]